MGPAGVTGLGALAVAAAVVSAIGLLVAVESLAAVVLAVSVVWLVLHAASKLRAATGAAQRAEALFQE
ncbi:hypothetical protein GCM10027422_03410 [Hymenobacter arcticus]